MTTMKEEPIRTNRPILNMLNPKGIKKHQILRRNSKDTEKKIQRTYKIFTDGSKKPQNTVYSAEQEAIIKEIYVTKRKGERRVIITDSLSTLMAVEGDINSKNPKTLSLRKLLDEEREKFTLLWVPGHRRRSKSCPGKRPLSHRKIPTTRSD
jgi:hypothetical protein